MQTNKTFNISELSRISNIAHIMPSSLHQNLRRLIGQHYRYLSDEWILIDVLAEEDRVVLQRADPDATPRLQTDQFGRAWRHVPETLTLAISSPEDPETYSEEMLLLLGGRI